jgi:deoxyribodipyrimidine photolyase-related protein
MHAFLLFPHQLFEQPLPVPASTPIFLIENDLFFTQYHFHQQKIVLHRSSMKYYQQRLEHQQHLVTYIEHHQPESRIPQLIRQLAAKKIRSITLYSPNDNWLEKQLRSSCKKEDITCTFLPSPNFINNLPEDLSQLGKRRPYFQTGFYIQQRKKHQLLLTPAGEPLGGQWTYDVENRKKIPAKTPIPALHFSGSNTFIHEAISYTKKYFALHPGTTDAPFLQNKIEQYYPCTHAEAAQALEEFMRTKLTDFGQYEDAMLAQETTLFHSVLSPLLNIGLLQPMQVIHRLINYANTHSIPLNSIEGIVRQILGWREFIQLIYRESGTQQRTKNFWQFTHPMPAAFYTATTGIPPIDLTIRKLLHSGYNHHIERLMVLGNFMLLCEIHPDAVYQWFMELYIDAYDWVMVPNIYGMSQYSDGGMMTSKPYICGSNYLMKIGNFPKGDWQAIWDGLFWRFLSNNRKVFGGNPRWAMLIKTWDKMELQKQEQHLQAANNFLQQLHSSGKKSQPLPRHPQMT